MHEIEYEVYPEDDELWNSEFRSRYGADANSLFGCDVCYTCLHFDCMRFKCRFPGNMYWIRIKSPHIFRCSYWGED